MIGSSQQLKMGRIDASLHAACVMDVHRPLGHHSFALCQGPSQPMNAAGAFAYHRERGLSVAFDERTSPQPALGWACNIDTSPEVFRRIEIHTGSVASSPVPLLVQIDTYTDVVTSGRLEPDRREGPAMYLK